MMTKLLQNESYTQVCTANRTQSGKVGICFKSKKILIYNKIIYHIFSVHLHTAGFLSLFFSFLNSGKHMIETSHDTYNFQTKKCVNIFLHDGQIALFFCIFCSRIFYMKEPIRVEGSKKFLQVIFSVLGFAFSPNMYCKKLVREGAKTQNNS